MKRGRPPSMHTRHAKIALHYHILLRHGWKVEAAYPKLSADFHLTEGQIKKIVTGATAAATFLRALPEIVGWRIDNPVMLVPPKASRGRTRASFDKLTAEEKAKLEEAKVAPADTSATADDLPWPDLSG